MKSKPINSILSIIASALGMWILAGLWHNLILPTINSNVQAHHQGMGLMLAGYFILAILMFILYNWINKKGKLLVTGFVFGALTGILWVFPHGLVMAGAHDSSVVYEIKNMLWHIIEQGIGGLIIASIIKK